jgi:hypothetical protein
VSITPHADLAAQRLLHRLPQGDADVLDGVVRIDVQVALRLDVEVEHAVAPHLVEHVIEERDAGGEPGAPGAVQIDAHGDLRLRGVPGDLRGAGGDVERCVHDKVFRTRNTASFSAGVPTVMRRHRASSGCQPFRFLTRIPASRNAANGRVGVRHARDTKLVSLGNTERWPARRAPCDTRALGADRRACSASTACREQHRRDGLHQRADVVRRAHLVELGDPLRRAHGVTERSPAMPIFETVRTTTRLGWSSTRGEERVVRERVIRLVHDDQARRRGEDALDARAREAVARRIVGIGEPHQRGRLALDGSSIASTSSEKSPRSGTPT